MQENQSFTTFDTVSVLGLVLVVLVTVTTIISRSMGERKELQAHKRARQLALQILVGGVRTAVAPPLRGDDKTRDLASFAEVDIKTEGRIGMDPWGRPYYYRIIEDGSGKVAVAVLSSGPNRQRETFEDHISLETQSGLKARVLLQGDDIGGLEKEI